MIIGHNCSKCGGQLFKEKILPVRNVREEKENIDFDVMCLQCGARWYLKKEEESILWAVS
jgi:hypothetical protein